ncbi:MAG: DNA-directed RNA polymerase subunit omega [Proteobacteria bacterium]|nr:MAG: DNA-directed RNA polymerase subunit omega [Pseudomonadota bacterium]
MARFTVADCMETIHNRFDMTLAAAMRARQIEKGSDILVEQEEGDKATVIALREIADKQVDTQILNRVE